MPRTSVCLFSTLVVFAALITITAAITASAQTRNRITQRIADTEPVVVSSPHRWPRAEFDQGRVEGSLNINHAAIVFKLAPSQQADLEKLLAEQQDPHSANYRHWLTPEQYAARFGMSDGDLAQVTSWLKSQGLTVDGFSRARTRVFFSGTAAQVEGVFHTELHRYLVNGQMSLANATEISVPQAISGMVLGFRGLENLPPPAPGARGQAELHFASYRATISWLPATLPRSTTLFPRRCSMEPDRRSRWWGRPTFNFSDIDAFRTAAGLPARPESST